MSSYTVEKEIYDMLSTLEEKMSRTLFLSSIPLPLKSSRIGSKYLGYYIFYEDKCLRLEYQEDKLLGCSFWDTPGDLLNSEIRVDLSNLDPSEVIPTILKLLSSLPGEEDKESEAKEVQDFIDYMGEFVTKNGSKYAYDSYKIWAESKNKEPISEESFYRVFNKNVLQRDEDLTSILEDGLSDEDISISEKDSIEFSEEVTGNKEYYSYKYLTSMLKCMVDEDTEINASFICGEYVDEARYLIKNYLQDEGSWVKKTIWKEKTTSIYQFLSVLWKYRSGYILIFNNVDSPVNNKDHNFYMLLDNLMNTENPNRIVSYSRKENKHG